MEPNFINIDGGYLEGGGQILRMSLALSAITKRPIIINNIRKSRPKPGLGHQHLSGLKLVAEMCNAKITGAELGSEEVTFIPGEIKGGHYFSDCKTAGSVSLLIQAAYPCALFAKEKTLLELRGGTNAKMAPPTDFTLRVFRKIIEKFGAMFHISTDVRGFYPRGGGQVRFDVTPVSASLKPLELLDCGKIKSINGISLVAGTLPIKLAHQMADSASNILSSYEVEVNIKRVKETLPNAVGNATTIILWAETTNGCLFGGSAIGEPKMRSEEVGSMAADDLSRQLDSGGCIDYYTQDQVIILMCLAAGKSRIRTGPLTDHTKTAIYVAELITKVKFNIIEEDNTVIMECEGIGATP